MSIATAVLEFLDVPTASSWDMPPQRALDFFQGKGLRTTFNWQEMLGEEHARAFTVAKMMDADLLATVQESLQDALAAGVPFQAWADQLVPMLQAKGWWGKKDVVAPNGQVTTAQLGSPARLQTIYRANMQSAYAAGQWDEIADQADLAPYLMYDAVDDFRTRPEHRAWDGVVLPVSDPWWKTHYPPNGWNCRCSVIQLSADDLADMGLAESKRPKGGTYAWTNPATGKVERIPNGVDPGWQGNVGQARNNALAKAVTEKLASYPQAVRQAAAKGYEAAAKAGKAAAAEAGASTRTGLTTKGLAKGGTKAAERAAQRQVQAALDKGTTYLAPALRSIMATPAGKAMQPSELLTAAQAQAGRVQQQAGLADYRKAFLADRKPSARAQAAFDALPDDARQALQDTLQASRADSALQTAASAELADIRAMGAGSAERAALEAVEAYAGDNAKPTELLAAVMMELRSTKARQGLADALLQELKDALQDAGVELGDEALRAMVARIAKGRGLPG